MSKSKRLTTAIHIMLYLARQDRRVRIKDLCHSLPAHPSRLRQITSRLVQAGFIQSFKGARGGIALKTPLRQITLLSLSQCLEERQFLSMKVHEVNRQTDFGEEIHLLLSQWIDGLEQRLGRQLAETTLADFIEHTVTPQ